MKAASRYGITPAHLAAQNGNPTIAEALLKAGANPNATLPEGETVLMTAARTGNVDVIRALVSRGADVNASEQWQGQTPLMWAASQNNAGAVKALIELGADKGSKIQASEFSRIQVRDVRAWW